MKFPKLGLVCMTSDNEIRFSHLTRTRLMRLSQSQQQSTLRELYQYNLATLEKAIKFCANRGIFLYRVYSNTFPFFDTELGNIELHRLAKELKLIGHAAKSAGIRLVSHPDQFVVLNSDRIEVIENSIKILHAHANLFDLLDQPRSPWAACNIHPGKANREARLLETINGLADPIRARLTLENDEFSYNGEDTYEICMRANIPMVFDAHHHVISEKCKTYDDSSVIRILEKARQTWQPNEQWQLVHISNGAASFDDRKHHDFVTEIPRCFKNVEWIEVEAKQKELAIDKLQTIINAV